MSNNNNNDLQSRREADYERFKTAAAYTFLVASPILIALPPRKLDNLTVLLTGAFCISANHLTHERTGRSIMDRIEARIAKNPISAMNELPSERAREIQAQLKAARDAQIRDRTVVGEELDKLKARQESEKPALERIWMGGESEGWKERRMREEQKALEEGRGYGDLIKEHIWDVWTWGKKEDGEEGTEEGKSD
ncbi:hypothetical protein BO70DRAFT_145038 [Aspergillus heteromorphus CBS 117.55]|uniref:Rhomboid family membrane protein n=1 Tax=Aspergillus heteromorphus CBS 117.55 TaxID=1448321 RepID=A0A317V8N5_9EURO|nr:uncharacterized protein BO70DRAFT_145038 [Aspergillus heteromorphus CBS 117.55]PWY69719.1 hypothetical protein BO70DRAFT_145038 [Aspergillus heteromorphus CBS 117.55]